MSKREIFFRDQVVEKVVDKFVSRSDVGFAKYGQTLHDERTKKVKGLYKYLNDVQEELMDAILYIQACKDEIEDLNEKSLLKEFSDSVYLSKEELYDIDVNIEIDEDRINIIAQNGNDGLHYEK